MISPASFALAQRMKLLKQIGLALPVLRKTLACEACGETFACEISLGKVVGAAKSS